MQPMRAELSSSPTLPSSGEILKKQVNTECVYPEARGAVWGSQLLSEPIKTCESRLLFPSTDTSLKHVFKLAARLNK